MRFVRIGGGSVGPRSSVAVCTLLQEGARSYVSKKCDRGFKSGMISLKSIAFFLLWQNAG